MKKNLLLIVAMLLVGVASVLADDVTYSPTQDVYFRTSLSGETYSWNNGYPKTASSDNNTFAGNLRVGMFVLQKYEVANLNNATSIKIVLTGNSGTDALAFWTFTNDWAADTDVATLAAAVNTAVGLNLNTTGTPTGTPLVNGTNTRTTVETGTNTLIINKDIELTERVNVPAEANLTIEDCAFENCTVPTGSGVVFIGLDGTIIKGNNTFTDCSTNIFLEAKRVLVATDATHTTPISILLQNTRSGRRRNCKHHLRPAGSQG